MNPLKNLQHKQPLLLIGTTSEGNAVTLTGSDFDRHKVISGITGSGKSTFLAWIALTLLRLGVAFSLIDPHGDLCRLILQLLLSSDFFSSQRSFQRLWFVDFNRTDSAIPFNVLKQPHDSHSTANNVLEALHRAFPSVGTTAALDNTFLAATYVLTENGRPITDIQQLLLDASFRKSLLQHIADPLVVQFFESKLAEKANSNLIDSTMRRSFLLTFSPQLRNTLSQVENKLDFRDLMDNGVSCLFSLGGLDDQSKRLLGCLLMVSLEQAFLSRATVSPDRRFPYHVIVDEFPLFSASGDSFSVILEQVRKYAGTLYLAHQTQSQLSKGIAGSLQNAIPIVMKAGTEDSSTLVSRFYRPVQEEPGFFDFLFGNHAPPSPFTDVQNVMQARQIFETLQRQEAIVTLHGKAQKIVTPTLPIGKVDHTKLTALENAYARYLLTPLQERQTIDAASSLSAAPVSHTQATPLSTKQPLQFLTGDLTTDIQKAFTTFSYLTLQQVTIFTNKSSNYVRNKLNSGVADGTVAKIPLPRTTAGKPSFVYFPSSQQEKKHGYLEHTILCNSVLIAGVQLPQVKETIQVLDLRAERTLKTTPIVLGSSQFLVPDGFLHLRMGNKEKAYCFEIDRNSEGKNKLAAKLTAYASFLSRQIYTEAFQVEHLTIVFLVTFGGSLRVSQLVASALAVIPEQLQDSFLFATVSDDMLTPDLFSKDIFTTVASEKHTLLDF